ncbi:MAG: DNA translocase FtsK 4TM domain-containing protein [Roseburia sp.]
MATANKKRTAGRKKAQSGGGTNTRRKGKTVQAAGENFTREVVLWIVVAVSLLLFISNFGVGGTVGNAVSRFFFGVFGLIAYIFPVVLLGGTFFAVSNRGNRIAVVKIVATVLFVVFLCMFIELCINGKDVRTAAEAYRYSYEHKFGGGFIGGLLARLLCPNFGLIGSFVIDVIVLIIALVLITEKSALRGMQKSGKKVYESARVGNERYKERAELRREERELRREERELRRMDKKVEGVSIDTRLMPESAQGRTDEISEIDVDKIDITQFLDLPEVKEEHHVTLTAGGECQEETTPSAFSDEALRALYNPEECVSEVSAQTVFAGVEDIFARQERSAAQDLPQESFVSQEPAAPRESSLAKPQESVTDPVAGSDVHRIHRNEKQRTEQIADNVSDIESEIRLGSAEEQPYVFPPIDLLAKAPNKAGDSRQHLQETAMKLQQTLKNFSVSVTITNISCGPAVTRYELQPEMGVKVSKIVNLADDIKLNLAAADIRIEAPIPGKAAIGIEVPNKENVMVSFRELVESGEFKEHTSNISFCVGKDIAGKVTVADIAKMPHLLIAGSTGSGKSVCINTIIMSMIYKANPRDVKLILVDPKVVELSVYNGIPHLMIPVVTDPKKAAGALHWAVAEMTERYQKFAGVGVRDLKGYNAKIDALPTIEGDPKPEKLPQIVIIVDELADLMMVAPGDVEEAICRLAQLARACGIHLIIATQRPSVNVITGLIKANMPSRIAFAVTSGIDSRTILDMNGAEKLLGKGDMLFNPQGVPKPVRVQGAFVSDKEVSDVVGFLKENNSFGSYNAKVEEKMNSMDAGGTTVGIDSGSGVGDGRDAYFAEAASLLIEKEKGSIGMLQRYFKIGFNRAARIMDQLEEAGIVGPEEGTKPRRVLMSPEQFEQYKEDYL